MNPNEEDQVIKSSLPPQNEEDIKEANDQTIQEENQQWYNARTHQFIQSLTLRDNHKTVKGIQSKLHHIAKYTDQTIDSICQIPIDPINPITKDNVNSIVSSILSKLEMFKESLRKYNVLSAVLTKKFINATFIVKCQLISIASKAPASSSSLPVALKKGPITKEDGNKNNSNTAKAKAASFSRQIVQQSVNEKKHNTIKLLSLNETNYIPIHDIQYIDFPTVAQSHFNLDDLLSSKESETNTVNAYNNTVQSPQSHCINSNANLNLETKPNSIAVFGTTQNLFFALGYTDLLIIADSSMSIVDKLTLEKSNSLVNIHLVSAYYVFFSHMNNLHIFNYETKQSKSLSFDHCIVSISPVLYYINCLCVLDSYATINLIDYIIPKKLGSFSNKGSNANISDSVSNVISLSNHLILGGSTIKLFDLKNKKLIPSPRFIASKKDSVSVLPISSNPIMKMIPIVLNGTKHIDSFACLMKNGNLEMYSLDKGSHLHKISYYTYEGSEPSEYYNILMTRKNLIIASVGFDIKVFSVAIKEEVQLGYMPLISVLATLRVNNVVRAVFDINHSLILHGEDAVERFMFFDLEEVFMKNREFNDDNNNDNDNEDGDCDNKGISERCNERSIKTQKMTLNKENIH